MNLIFRIEELTKKAFFTITHYGLGELFHKLRIFLSKNLLGKNFGNLVARGSYSLLWNKVFDSYRTKGLLVATLRFILVLFFGWIVFFITPKEIDFVPDQRILSNYKRNKQKVTVVIPTYNDYQLTKNCVDSIHRYCDKEYVNIVVVDDGSSEKFITKLVETLPVKVIERKENGGFAKTVNEGLRNIDTDIVILNNDTLVTKGWLEALQYWAYTDPRVGIVGPKLVYPDKTIQWAGTFRNQEEPDWFDHYYRFKPADYLPSNFSHQILSATGACMYIKKEVIKAVGLLDEKFGMAFEDVDYCIRAWQEGFKVVYCPKSVVIHLESKTRGKKQGEREIKSKEYFWEKWRDWFEKRKLSENNKLNIIYVNQDNGVGGGPRVIFEHLNRLAERGHEVSLYSIDKAPDWFDLKVPVKVFKSYVDLVADLETRDALKVATWWETEEAVWEASLKKGTGVFFVQDIESSYYSDDPDYEPKVLSHYRKELHYLTISSWDQEKLAELDLNSTVVSPGISEIFVNKNLVRNEKEILALGRHNPLKNFSLTAKAWKLLKNKYTLKLFGIEPRIGRELGVDYIYKPTDRQVVDLYNSSGVFVQTSVHEGFCLPILEAMACGLPVVTTDSDGNKDFYKDKVNCLICSKEDEKDVAAKIDKILTDTELRTKLVSEGLKVAEGYRWKKKIDQLENYYKDLARRFGNNIT